MAIAKEIERKEEAAPRELLKGAIPAKVVKEGVAAEQKHLFEEARRIAAIVSTVKGLPPLTVEALKAAQDGKILSVRMIAEGTR